MNTHTASGTIAHYAIADLEVLKQKMLNWASRFNIFLFLDSHQYGFQPQHFECLLGVGVRSWVDDLSSLDAFVQQPRWCFGHLAYDLKEELHGLETGKKDPIGFPHLHFFEPEVVLYVKDNTLTIEATDPGAVWQALQETIVAEPKMDHPVVLTPRLTRRAYLDAIGHLQQHIRRGDCYEINFCQELYAENVQLNPVPIYRQLSAVSPAPFAALYRYHNRYLISASPERFLNKKGGQLIAQPMKGTARRNLQDAEKDAVLKRELYLSTKERSENVMVVDLVRNDLSQVCADASVKVDELYGIYSFPQVHQMVSTISGTIRPAISFSQLLQANFPMGSMTGAPKLRVMQLVDQYEPSARGIFSGSVGYFTPAGDFDFNVVIRSIMYNADNGYVSCQVGSGITFYSNAEREWEECLLKAAAIRKVLEDR
ncbi:para-aminobenzoate synthetase component 1 [Cnuella takakiae]|uniref:Para-aminobenzoate synthetase component 1 n=1 Tax=Cnuella takakiae TaxID=1302690 RepID=A0A1M4WPK4_9BACT|nr:anthranilate synthase component I family protein [Cnuella takakiae]OLY91656.1 hypothetical protein BUE76_06925 [Cnuella takakiae]SHE83166.1 para-aminobenzoate synthetase component 1 [Cnuella takakiae]